MEQQKEQKTYPISRFMSDPVGRGVLSGGITAASLGVARSLGKKGIIKGIRPGILNLKNRHLLLAGLLSGVTTGAFTHLSRKAYPGTIRKKLREGGEVSKQERNLLLKGIDVKKGSGRKSLKEHLFSPASMALLGGGLYGTLLTKKPGLKPAALGAASFGIGALLDRYFMARGLAGRAATRKGLSEDEARLLGELKNVRSKYASGNFNYIKEAVNA